MTREEGYFEELGEIQSMEERIHWAAVLLGRIPNGNMRQGERIEVLRALVKSNEESPIKCSK